MDIVGGDVVLMLVAVAAGATAGVVAGTTERRDLRRTIVGASTVAVLVGVLLVLVALGDGTPWLVAVGRRTNNLDALDGLSSSRAWALRTRSVLLLGGASTWLGFIAESIRWSRVPVPRGRRRDHD